MTFETFLREKHSEEYVGTKDWIEKCFDIWAEDLDFYTLILYAEEWHRQEIADIEGHSNKRELKKYPKYYLETEALMSEIWRSCLVGKISDYEFRSATMDII